MGTNHQTVEEDDDAAALIPAPPVCCTLVWVPKGSRATGGQGWRLLKEAASRSALEEERRGEGSGLAGCWRTSLWLWLAGWLAGRESGAWLLADWRQGGLVLLVTDRRSAGLLRWSACSSTIPAAAAVLPPLGPYRSRTWRGVEG